MTIDVVLDTQDIKNLSRKMIALNFRFRWVGGRKDVNINNAASRQVPVSIASAPILAVKLIPEGGNILVNRALLTFLRDQVAMARRNHDTSCIRNFSWRAILAQSFVWAAHPNAAGATTKQSLESLGMVLASRILEGRAVGSPDSQAARNTKARHG